MLQLACKDAGFACKAVFLAKNEEELERQMEEHAVNEHGLETDDFTPEFQRKVKSLIQRS